MSKRSLIQSKPLKNSNHSIGTLKLTVRTELFALPNINAFSIIKTSPKHSIFFLHKDLDIIIVSDCNRYNR